MNIQAEMPSPEIQLNEIEAWPISESASQNSPTEDPPAPCPDIPEHLLYETEKPKVDKAHELGKALLQFREKIVDYSVYWAFLSLPLWVAGCFLGLVVQKGAVTIGLIGLWFLGAGILATLFIGSLLISFFHAIFQGAKFTLLQLMVFVFLNGLAATLLVSTDGIFKFIGGALIPANLAIAFTYIYMQRPGPGQMRIEEARIVKEAEPQ